MTVKTAATVPLSPSVTVTSLMDRVAGGGGLQKMPICPPWIVGVAVSLTEIDCVPSVFRVTSKLFVPWSPATNV